MASLTIVGITRPLAVLKDISILFTFGRAVY